MAITFHRTCQTCDQPFVARSAANQPFSAGVICDACRKNVHGLADTATRYRLAIEIARSGLRTGHVSESMEVLDAAIDPPQARRPAA